MRLIETLATVSLKTGLFTVTSGVSTPRLMLVENIPSTYRGLQSAQKRVSWALAQEGVPCSNGELCPEGFQILLGSGVIVYFYKKSKG